MKTKRIHSRFFKTSILLVLVILLSIIVSGCEKKVRFADESALKKHIVGTWVNDMDDSYHIFTDTEYFIYDFDWIGLQIAFSETFQAMQDGDMPVEQIEFEEFTESFYDTWLSSVQPTSLTWDYKKGTVSTYGDAFIVEKDGSLRRKSDDAIYTKLSDDTESYQERWSASAAEFAEDFKTEQKKLVFDRRWENLPSAREVQYNKLGYLGENFKITGTAQLDDYYNYSYRGLESIYFCIKIRPEGGTYKNEWYIYASRSDYKDLLDRLMTSSTSVTLICQLYFFDTGSNNMATLIDYRVN